MSWWLVPALLMVAQDVCATVLTMMEASERPYLSGLLDTLMWIAGILCTNRALIALNSPHPSVRDAVIAAVSCANFVGTVAGVKVGARIRKRHGATG